LPFLCISLRFNSLSVLGDASLGTSEPDYRFGTIPGDNNAASLFN